MTQRVHPTIPARDLRPGMHVLHDRTVFETRYILPYADQTERVLVVGSSVRTGRPVLSDVAADTPMALITDAAYAEELEAEHRRAAVVAGLRELATMIELHQLPLPRYTDPQVTIGALELRADLDRWIGHLDAEVRATSAGIPFVDTRVGGLRLLAQALEGEEDAR